MLRVNIKAKESFRVHLVFVLKWRPLANSVIVAPLADVFSSIPQIARLAEVIILGERFFARLTFSNVMPWGFEPDSESGILPLSYSAPHVTSDRTRSMI